MVQLVKSLLCKNVYSPILAFFSLKPVKGGPGLVKPGSAGNLLPMVWSQVSEKRELAGATFLSAHCLPFNN